MEDYRIRQEHFLNDLPNDSIVLIPTNPISYRSNDTTYPYRASSYMLYLCGWDAPEAVFMAYRASDTWVTSIFVQPRDTKAEIWEGRRVGVEGASSNWPIDEAHSLSDIDEIISEKFKNSNKIYSIPGSNSLLDKIIHKSGSEVLDPREILDNMRVIKTEGEIKLMKKSASLASLAHIEGMKKTFSGIGEWEIQSIIESYFSSNKSCTSYNSIVGGGDNATILHYNSNDIVVNEGNLVLVDAGCEVYGYASDITRTWPVNGKFTIPQKEIYSLVLRAEIAGINACQVGAPWSAMHHAASEVLAQGLIDLGILKCSFEEALGENYDGKFRNFFMHGTGHMLGLDVHDVGGGRQGDKSPERILQSGMVLTVEPGLYFGSWRTDIEIPSRYSGIGIRIEDDVLITDTGPVVLTSECPKEISEIESLVGNGLSENYA
ncbi:aminopeptidase P N-terminal domain-containing protein [bacterium]|nr:aminopeptidase P N-terminal domain-containing protein [bacterium]